MRKIRRILENALKKYDKEYLCLRITGNRVELYYDLGNYNYELESVSIANMEEYTREQIIDVAIDLGIEWR